MKLSEAVKSHIEICRPLRQTDSPNAPRTVASSPRRLVDLALVTQNRGFDPMDLEITVFILYNVSVSFCKEQYCSFMQKMLKTVIQATLL